MRDLEPLLQLENELTALVDSLDICADGPDRDPELFGPEREEPYAE